MGQTQLFVNNFYASGVTCIQYFKMNHSVKLAYLVKYYIPDHWSGISIISASSQCGDQ